MARKPSPLPDWFNEVTEWYTSGKSLKQIAQHVGVAQATVRRWFIINGIQLRESGGRCTFDYTIAINMWKSGHTLEQIAEHLGVNRNAVYEQLKKHNVDTSPRWHYDKVHMEELIRLGLSDSEVSDQIGCSTNIVERHRRDVLGIYTQTHTDQLIRKGVLYEALQDKAVDFEQFRTLFPNERYGALVQAFIRVRPDEWKSYHQRGAIDPSLIEEVVSALKRGDSKRSIYEKYQTTPTHINRLIDEHGIDYQSRSYRIDPLDYAKLTDRNWCNGVLSEYPTCTATWIAREFFDNRLSTDTVRTYFAIHGLDPNNIRPLTDAIPQLTDKAWMEQQYQTKTILQIADELKVSHPTVRDAMIVMGITPRRTMHTSKVEKMVLDFIQQVYSGPVIENDRRVIAPQELDILLPEKRIAIEVCGMYWHSEKFKPNSYHYDKMVAAEQAGYRLVTVYEEELNDEAIRPLALRKLRHIIGTEDRGDVVNARKCSVVDMTTDEAMGFMTANHIQGYINASIRYGLCHNGRIVAAVTFKRHKSGEYELSRFATSAHVRGGFSKLLHHFMRNNTWDHIFTFADLRWSSRHANVYLTAGFTEEHVTAPAYRYYSPSAHKSFHRMHFQRKHLERKLKNFDPGLTERENANRHGYLAIYDCGNVKYRLTNPQTQRMMNTSTKQE